MMVRCRRLLVLPAVAFLLGTSPMPSPAAVSPPFDIADAIRVESVQPILDGEVARAHREALDAGFRRALSMVVAGSSSARRAHEGAILGQPERYVRGYRIVEQVRGEFHYRLVLLLWVDRRLLREEGGIR